MPASRACAPAGVDAGAWQAVRHLAFARAAASGEFTDYTARYGALQGEDALSVRARLSRSAAALPGQVDAPVSADAVDRALALMGLREQADLPAIALSSGQTRRARIAHALVFRPRLLLLEDPMAGLDAPGRARVGALLARLNKDAAPRVVLVLRDRGADTLPDWVTHVADVRAGHVWIGPRADWDADRQTRQAADAAAATYTAAPAEAEAEAPVAELRGVSVRYGERAVLRDVDWRIAPGSRWHVQGGNGSGKTTLLSVLLGHHPQSYALPAGALALFGRPRRALATTVLRRRVGHASPEIFAAFPRSMGLSAYDAVGTGFEGVFSRRALAPEQRARVLQLLERFAPALRAPRDPPHLGTRDLARRDFAHFAPPQQALLLFLRAVVARPPLLVLDEPAQGMDEQVWASCCALLRDEWRTTDGARQAVVVVTHYDDEVPWRGGRVLRLRDGVAETTD